MAFISVVMTVVNNLNVDLSKCFNTIGKRQIISNCLIGFFKLKFNQMGVNIIHLINCSGLSI